MISYIIVAATTIVGIAGLTVATWSIHRTHNHIAARHERASADVCTMQ